MAGRDFNFHFVSTREQARELLDSQETLHVADCRCREAKGDCLHSRMDVCVHFHPEPPRTRPISAQEAADILEEARTKHLVPRPFRTDDGSGVAGICFCCEDCCTYFANRIEACDKGASIERTAMEDCLQCGACEDVCYFHARAVVDGTLHIDRDKCYGCGLCVDVCPAECVRMVAR